MFALVDTFNGRTMSQHRTLKGAVAAQRRLDRSFTGGAYLPTVIAAIVTKRQIGRGVAAPGVRLHSAVHRYGTSRLRPLTDAEVEEAQEICYQLSYPNNGRF